MADAHHRVSVGAPFYSAHFVWHPHMAWSHAVIASGAAAGPRGNAGIVTRLPEYLARLFAPHWPLPHSNEATPVTVVSHHGAVEIWETHVGLSVQTCVKGEPDRARATALQRIASYLAGNNRIGTRFRAAGPLVQSEQAPGRWLVRVELLDAEDVSALPLSRNRKLRIRPAQSEVLAVLRMSGRPTPQTIARGDAVIHAALAGTLWTPTGGPMIRLYRPPSILPFANHFEVAVPIARRSRVARPQRTKESSSRCEPMLERGNTLSQPRGLDLA
jgi:hypothetical protein